LALIADVFNQLRFIQTGTPYKQSWDEKLFDTRPEAVGSSFISSQLAIIYTLVGGSLGQRQPYT